MPAYFDTGFSVRQPMWHGGGLVLDEYPEDWNDARDKAGLMWEPMALVPHYVIDPEHAKTVDLDVFDEGTWEKREDGSVMVADPRHLIIVRDDSFQTLGATSDTFKLIYHRQMGELLEALLDVAGGSLKFETAGSCGEVAGQQVWALCYLDEPFQTPGDESESLPFFALLNNHDGAGACKGVYTQVRVVCWNTFQMASAYGDRSGYQVVIRHAGNVEERLEQAKSTLQGLRKETADYIELATEMSKLNVNDRQVRAFIEEFIPSPADHGVQISDRVKGNIDKAREMFRSIYLDSPTTDGVRGSAWGLVQSATEYLDHARGYRNQDSFMGRSILGVEKAKSKALTLARQVSK